MSTSRKPASRAAAAAKVDFDFNALETDPDKPMRIRIPSGRVISLVSVRDLPWQVVMSWRQDGDLEGFFNAVVAPEDRKDFLAESISLRQMEAFQDAYLSYFELTAGSPGESDA